MRRLAAGSGTGSGVRPGDVLGSGTCGNDGCLAELWGVGQAQRDRSASACELLVWVFDSQADVDPAAETREFTLLTFAYGVGVTGAALAPALPRRRWASGSAGSGAVQRGPAPRPAEVPPSGAVGQG